MDEQNHMLNKLDIILAQAEREIDNLLESKKMIQEKAQRLLVFNVTIMSILFGTISTLSWLSVKNSALLSFLKIIHACPGVTLTILILIISCYIRFVYWPIYNILKPREAASSGLPPKHFGEKGRHEMPLDKFKQDLVKCKQGSIDKGNLAHDKLDKWLKLTHLSTMLINLILICVLFLLFITPIILKIY